MKSGLKKTCVKANETIAIIKCRKCGKVSNLLSKGYWFEWIGVLEESEESLTYNKIDESFDKQLWFSFQTIRFAKRFANLLTYYVLYKQIDSIVLLLYYIIINYYYNYY